MSIRRRLAVLLSLVCVGWGWAAAEDVSVYPLRPDDAHAVYLSAKGDGIADDSDALQQAIDRVQETVHHGVVFVPEGRYRLTRTIHVWAGIRLIGYGAKRPVFVLGAKTPGFQEGPSDYMLWFTDERTPEGQPIADASEFTFYSAVSNIDFEIGDGNPAAVAIRFNVAQHSFVSHADFHLGSARAAIEQVGNQASDIHVYGGEFGIVTGKTSPAWQFLLMDSSFAGQRTAAIRTHEAGMTLVRDSFERVPVAIEIPQGEVEQLYGRDLRMRNVSQTVLRLGSVSNLRNEITLENVGCAHVKRFVEGAAGFPAAAASFFMEERFALGLEIGPDGREKGIALEHSERRLQAETPAVASDIPALPPMSTWVNVKTLGAKGDGGTDDTDALQKAIDEHATLYFPSGFYLLSGSLRLRPDTTLIGFSPFATQLILGDFDPRFFAREPAIPLLVAPHGGTNIVTGIGIATGNGNPQAAGVEWMAGPHSMLEDVDFIRGHSEYVAALEPAAARPPGREQQPQMKLDEQHPSLWVHDGGGGILRGIWSHGGTAEAGLLIENTDTPGAIYQFSCEHHMRNEVRMVRAANWKVYDLQTEEEMPEGAGADALELKDSHDLLFANTYMYRVSRQVDPELYAVAAHGSARVDFDNVKVFSQTRLSFDNSVFDQGSGVLVRAHHFVHFALTDDLRQGAPLPLPAAFAPGAALEKVATGYRNASGLTADEQGIVYFTDAFEGIVERYDPEQKKADHIAWITGMPMALGFAAPGKLLALNRDTGASEIEETDSAWTARALGSETGPLAEGTKLLLPVGLHAELEKLTLLLEHKGYRYRVGSNTAKRSGLEDVPAEYFHATEGNMAIPAMPIPMFRSLLQSSQLAAFAVGDEHFLTSEEDARTWLGRLGPGRTLTTKLFTERGGTSVVSDTAGNVYIAGDQVYVYDHRGHPAGVLELPERPSSLCFGGKDRKTLVIGARNSLYAIRTAAAGE